MTLKPRLPILNPSHPLAQGLVGAWMAYEGAGLTARDASGRGNHGALQGNVGWVTGRDGPALDFPGTTSDYVSMSPAITGYPFAVTARFVASGAGTFRNIYNESDDSVNDRYILLRLTSSDALEYRIANGGGTASPTSSDTYTSGVHTATAISYASNDHRLYVDGSQVAAEATILAAPTLNTATIGIFLRASGPATPYDDEISFAQVHNRALPASQIRALHADPYAAFRVPRRWLGGLPESLILAAETGALNLTGQDAGLLLGRLLSAGTGVITLTGQDATFVADRVLSAGLGTITFTGVQVAFSYSGEILGSVVELSDAAAYAVVLTDSAVYIVELSDELI